MNKNSVLYKIHRMAGAISALFVFITALSGSVLIWQYVFHENYSPTIEADLHLDINKVSQSAQSQYPYIFYRFNRLPIPENKAVELEFFPKGEERFFVWLHPETGEVLKKMQRSELINKNLLDLHYKYFIGDAGKWLMAFVLMLFLTTTISGIIVYKKLIFIGVKLIFSPIVFKKHTFFAWLHRSLASWIFAFNFLIGITAIFMAIKVLKPFFTEKNESNFANAVFHPNIDSLWNELKLSHLDFEVKSIHVTPNEHLIKFKGKFKNENYFYSSQSSEFVFQGANGFELKTKFMSQQSWWERLGDSMRNIHEAGFAGIAVKSVYSVFAFLLALLSLSGFILYLKRR
jgi:uncharacterized iron-regulated membrane protein